MDTTTLDTHWSNWHGQFNDKRRFNLILTGKSIKHALITCFRCNLILKRQINFSGPGKLNRLVPPPTIGDGMQLITWRHIFITHWWLIKHQLYSFIHHLLTTFVASQYTTWCIKWIHKVTHMANTYNAIPVIDHCSLYDCEWSWTHFTFKNISDIFSPHALYFQFVFPCFNAISVVLVAFTVLPPDRKSQLPFHWLSASLKCISFE